MDCHPPVFLPNAISVPPNKIGRICAGLTPVSSKHINLACGSDNESSSNLYTIMSPIYPYYEIGFHKALQFG